MPDDNPASSDVTDTRRRFLKAAAAGGTAMIAGCSGDNDDVGEGGDGGDGGGGDGGGGDGGDGGNGGRIDRTFRIIPTNFNPPDMQYNYLNPKNWAQPVHKYIWDRWLWYMPQAEEYRPAVFSDWSFDGNTMTATIDGDQTWHDGDQVTAEDVVGHWNLLIGQSMFAQGQHQYFQSVQATDETTVEFTMHDAFNPDLVLQSTFHGDEARLYLKRSLFEEYMGDLETAIQEGDQAKLEELYGEIQQVSIDEPIGSYYAKQSQVESQYYQTETFEDYANADNINWTHNKFVAREEQQAMINEITAGNVDATPQFSIQDDAIMKQWPEDRIMVEVPDYGGRSVIFNHDTVPRPLRQAIAWVIDPEALLEGLPPNYTTITEPAAGMHKDAAEKWLGDVSSSFHSYNHDTDQATTILEDAGYSKDGDAWADPDGNPIELNFSSPPWADSAVPFAQIVGDHLNQFGITTEVNVRDGATWSNDLSTDNFDLSLTGWGQGPHPFFFLEDIFEKSHADYSNIANKHEFEVPPIGEWGGEPEVVNTSEILANLRTIQSDDEMRSGIQQLSWVVNYDMTVYTAVESFTSPHLLHPDRFNYTTDDESIRQNRSPIWDLPRYGELQAVE